MKTVAINMSGALRSFGYCSESINTCIIEELKKKYDVKLFGHFWAFNREQSDEINYDMKWKIDRRGCIDKINNYGFKKVCIEEYNSKWEKNIIDGCHGEIILSDYDKISDESKKNDFKSYAVNCMGMYYKIDECNKLIKEYEEESSIKFDYIVRMRPDFCWNDNLPQNILENISDRHIILVRDSYCIKANWPANDKFFMGTRDMMYKYCNIYDKLLYFHKKNIRVEGQNIAKGMIDDMDLNIVFFGNKNTYNKATDKYIRKVNKAALQRI